MDRRTKMKILENHRKEALRELDDMYEKTDQAIFFILEKFNGLHYHLYNQLPFKDKELFQKRYAWLTAYLRHMRLGDACIEITHELFGLEGDEDEDQKEIDETCGIKRTNYKW